MRVAIYTRVSTEQQVDRDSLAAQKSALLAYCRTNGYKDKGIRHYEDAGVSAKDADRKGLQRLLSDIRAGKIDLVIVTKIDRMMRSTQHMLELMEEFREHGVAFKSLGDPIDNQGPTGILLLQLLSVLAEFERRMTAERVRGVMDFRASRGQWNGGVIPFGYTTRSRIIAQLIEAGTPSHEASKQADKLAPQDKLLYVDADEAKVVRQVISVFREKKTILGTANELTRKGIRTRNGGEWTTTSVRRTLGNPMYIGKLTWGQRRTDEHSGKLKKAKHGASVFAARHEPILKEDVYAEVQQLLRETTQKPSRPFKQYLLGGLLHCRLCGRLMHGYRYTKGNGQTYIYYKCPKKRPNDAKPPCKGQSIPAVAFERYIIKEIMNLSRNREFLGDREKMIAMIRGDVEKRSQQQPKSIASLKTKREQTRKRMEALVLRLEDGTISPELFKERYQAHQGSLDQLESAIEKEASLEQQMAIHAASMQASWEQVTSFSRGWDKLNLEGKRNRLMAIVRSIHADRSKADLKLYLDRPDGGGGEPVKRGLDDSGYVDERVPLRLFHRPDAPVQMLAAADRQVPLADQRTAHRPYRHPRRGAQRPLPRTPSRPQRQRLGHAPRPGPGRPGHPARAVRPGFHHAQRPHDLASAPQALQARRHLRTHSQASLRRTRPQRPSPRQGPPRLPHHRRSGWRA